MLVFDFELILFRMAWWSSAGKELPPWLSALAVFISCRLGSVECVFLSHWVSTAGC